MLLKNKAFGLHRQRGQGTPPISRCQFNFREWQPAKSRTGVTFIWLLFQPFQFGNSTGYGDGNFSMFFRSLHRPIPVRYNGSFFFARETHSTTEFAMTVLSKCVCVCACWCVSSSVCVCAFACPEAFVSKTFGCQSVCV